MNDRMERVNNAMQITWSEEASAETLRRFGQEAGVWQLVFDAEGCGCSVNGVPTLRAIDAPAEGQLRADCDGFQVWYEKMHEVYFDEPLRIAYSPETRGFKLSSDSQIYTNRLKLEDARSAGATAKS